MKKFRIGDKVKFLNEKGGGTVVAIKNAYEVIVQLPDGLEIPYPASELISDTHQILINPSSASLEAVPTDNKLIYLAIESNTSQVKNATEYFFYLFNLSDFQFYFTYSLGKNNVYQCLADGKVQPYEKQRIKTLSVSLLKEADTHQFQMIFFQNTLFVSQTPVFETIKLNEKTFSSDRFIHHPEFARPVWIMILKEKFSDTPTELSQYQSPQNIRHFLNEEDLKKIQSLQEKKAEVSSRKHFSKQKYPDEVVMDLHIEELVDNPGDYSAHQKLQIQLNYFQRELHQAIAHNVRKITVIHGVGNGRLKQEVRAYLKTVEEVKAVEDAPLKMYGWGATVVYIK